MSVRVALPEKAQATPATRGTPHTTVVGQATHQRPLTTAQPAAVGESSAIRDGSPAHNLPDGKLASFG